METWSAAVRDLVMKDEWRALYLFMSIRTAASAKGMQRLSESVLNLIGHGGDMTLLPPGGEYCRLPEGT